MNDRATLGKFYTQQMYRKPQNKSPATTAEDMKKAAKTNGLFQGGIIPQIAKWGCLVLGNLVSFDVKK